MASYVASACLGSPWMHFYMVNACLEVTLHIFSFAICMSGGALCIHFYVAPGCLWGTLYAFLRGICNSAGHLASMFTWYPYVRECFVSTSMRYPHVCGALCMHFCVHPDVWKSLRILPYVVSARRGATLYAFLLGRRMFRGLLLSFHRGLWPRPNGRVPFSFYALLCGIRMSGQARCILFYVVSLCLGRRMPGGTLYAFLHGIRVSGAHFVCLCQGCPHV